MGSKSKYSIGIYEDGNNLYVASLVKEEGQVKLLNTEVYDLKDLGSLDDDTTQTGDYDSAEALLEKEADTHKDNQSGSEEISLSDDDIQLTMGDDENDLSLDDEVLSGLQQDVVSGSRGDADDDFELPGLKDESFANYSEVLYRIINRNSGSAQLSFTFQEPKVYYTNFFTDWGLDGPKLKQKVIQELSTAQSDFGVRIPDSVGIIKSASGELITVASDVVSDFKSINSEFQTKFSKHLPHISFIESDIVSLVNLINLNYDLSDEEISVVIYVGADHTRLIFLQGNQLLHISPLLTEGTDSILVFETIYNKILLEQDSLNLQRIDRIYTAGEAGEMGVKAYMSSMFTGDGQKPVEDIELRNLVVYDTEKFNEAHLSKFAIPIGAAWRALDKKNERLLDIDLTPAKLRESQKILKLGLSGWIIILLIFLMTWYFSWQISSLKHEIVTKKSEITVKKQELEYLQSLNDQLTQANQKLAGIKQSYSVLDSMLSRTKDYNKFIYEVSRKAKYYGGIWITEIMQQGKDGVQIKGYSLYRIRISSFTESLPKASLMQVVSSEIREKTVYHFQLSCRVPYRDKYGNSELIEAAVEKRMAELHKQEKVSAAEKPVETASIENKPAVKPAVVSNKQSTVAAKSVSASKPAGNRIKSPTIKNEQEFKAKYDQGRKMFNAYKYKEAIEIFSELINSGFDSKLMPNCYYWKGESYFGIKDYDNAIDNLKYVARGQYAKKSAAMFMIGRAYAAKGDSKTSEFYMNQVINYYPNEPIARKASEFKRKLR